MCHYIPHARHQGIHLVQVTGDEITLCLPYREALVGNPDSGALHGGALSVLLDHTLGTAGIAHDDIGPYITPTFDMRIDHLSVSPAGRDLFAFVAFLDTPARIIIEVVPEKTITFDGGVMRDRTSEALSQ